jgi:glycosyltransferase involved in cell wall biosynthesis
VDERRDVLHVITTASRRGAELFAVDLAARLQAQGRSCSTVALVASSVDTSPLPVPVPVLGSTRRGARTLRALRRRIRGACAVVAHGSAAIQACAVASVGTGVPLVVRSVGDPRHWATTARRRASVRLSLRKARVVVVLTAAAADAVVRVHGLPSTRIRVITNGVPVDRFPPVDPGHREEARRALGVPTDRPTVAFLGALAPEKDPSLAVRAMSKVVDAQLLIAGDGPEDASARAVADEVAPGRVTFLGSVADPTRVYAAADAVVASSRTEGLPAVLIEAGLSALPVVTTDVGFVRDIVCDGTTGFVVRSRDPEDLAAGIRRALDAPGSVGAAAREHCSAQFGLVRVAERWEQLLAEVTGHGPR